MTWAVERVDVEGDPDDDDAVVVGAGERRGDRDEAERRALERARPGTSCRPRGRGGSRGRRRRWWCRSGELAGQLGVACSARPRFCGGGGDRGLRAVGDPAQVAGEAGRHLEVEVAEELVAVVAVELQVEVAEGAGDRVRGAGDEARVEGPDLARAGAAVRARVEAEDLASSSGRARASFQGKNSASTVVDGAVGRGRHQAAIGGEEVELEVVERHLRQVVEDRPSAARSAGRAEPSRPAWRGSRSRRRSGTAGTGCRACGSPM